MLQHGDRHPHHQAQAGRKKGSKQAKATDTITDNQANSGTGGAGGSPGARPPDPAATPSGYAGSAFPGSPGTAGVSGVGRRRRAGPHPRRHRAIDNTTITGNHASTNDNDVSGTFSK